MPGTQLEDTRRIEKYHPLGPLDDGGMGQVFDGRIDFPMHQSRPCAIKFIHDDRRDARYVALFLREAMVGWDVSGHPNIVTTRSFAERRDGRLFIVLDKEGPALDRCSVQLRGRHARIRTIAENILYALLHLRRKRVAHGDISPANILLSSDGVAKLSDFGLARYEEEDQSERLDSPSYGFVGIPAYASPEVMSGARREHRSDLYSLGAVLYDLVTGGPPHGNPKPLPATVPGDLAELITRLLRHDPDDRPTVESALAILHLSDQPRASREEIAEITTEWIAKDEESRGQAVHVETAIKWLDAADAYLRRWPSHIRRHDIVQAGASEAGSVAEGAQGGEGATGTEVYEGATGTEVYEGADVANEHDAPAGGGPPPAQPDASIRRSITLPSSSLWIIAAVMTTIALVLAVDGASEHPENQTPVALELVSATPDQANHAESPDGISVVSGDAQQQRAATPDEARGFEPDESAPPDGDMTDKDKTTNADPDPQHARGEGERTAEPAPTVMVQQVPDAASRTARTRRPPASRRARSTGWSDHELSGDDGAVFDSFDELLTKSQ